MVPIFSRGSCLRDNKEDNEKRRKQDEKRLEIQCMILFRSKVFGSTKSKLCLKKETLKKQDIAQSGIQRYAQIKI